jgi:hypothetical protein
MHVPLRETPYSFTIAAKDYTSNSNTIRPAAQLRKKKVTERKPEQTPGRQQEELKIRIRASKGRSRTLNEESCNNEARSLCTTRCVGSQKTGNNPKGFCEWNAAELNRIPWESYTWRSTPGEGASWGRRRFMRISGSRPRTSVRRIERKEEEGCVSERSPVRASSKTAVLDWERSDEHQLY